MTDLVERVARAIWEAWTDDDDMLDRMSRAAIAVVLEEAAKVVEANDYRSADPHWNRAGYAAAIRAILQGEGE